MPRSPIAIEISGRRYAGDWQLDGREVCVGSAYGSRRVAVGRSRPERVAVRALHGLVMEWWEARKTPQVERLSTRDLVDTHRKDRDMLDRATDRLKD